MTSISIPRYVNKMQIKDTLQILSFIATTMSAITAVIAAIFISRQIANIRRNREVDTLFKLIALSDHEKTNEAKEWMKYELSSDMTIKQLKASKENLAKFYQLVHFFETMGVLVNTGYISERLVFDKYGLLIIGSWGKLQSLIATFRIENQSYEYAENFELLVAKYDNWVRRHPLKVARGERVKLKEAQKFLDYRKEQV